MEENHENSHIVCVRKEMRCKYDPEDLCSGAPDPLCVSADRDDRGFRNEMVDRVTTSAAGYDLRLICRDGQKTGISACPAAGLMIR